MNPPTVATDYEIGQSVTVHYRGHLHEIQMDIRGLRADMRRLLEASVCRLERSQEELVARALNGRCWPPSETGADKHVNNVLSIGAAESAFLETTPRKRRKFENAGIHGAACEFETETSPESTQTSSSDGARERGSAAIHGVNSPANGSGPGTGATQHGEHGQTRTSPCGSGHLETTKSKNKQVVRDYLGREKSTVWIDRAAKLQGTRPHTWGKYDPMVAMVRRGIRRCKHRRQELIKKRSKNLFFPIVQSDFFTLFTTMMIILNTIYLGFDVDQSVKREIARLEGQSIASDAMLFEYIFTVYFIIELCLKVAANPWAFVIGFEWKWNWFDAVLVVSATIEVFFKGTLPNVSFARIFRMCRLVRFVRVVRAFQFLHALRAMILGIFRSCVTLFWAFLMLALVAYIVAMVILNGVSDYLKTLTTTQDLRMEALTSNYGSLVTTLCRLFEGISGGDWPHMAEPLATVGDSFYFLWMFYVFAMLFGIANVVTGIVVDASVQQMTADRHEVVQENIERQHAAMNELRNVFFMADDDKSGTLSWSEFERHFGDEDLQHLFETLDIEFNYIAELFEILDYDGDDKVRIDEFVGGFMHAKGTARSIDVCGVLHTQQEIIKKLQTCTEMVDALKYRFENTQNDASLGNHAGVMCSNGVVTSASTEIKAWNL